MGIIATVTPSTVLACAVPRRDVKPNQISAAGAIQIQYYRLDNKALADVRYHALPMFELVDPTANLDVLWQSSLLFSPTRTEWSGAKKKGAVFDWYKVIFLYNSFAF